MTERKQTFSVKFKRKLFQGEIMGCLFFKIQPRSLPALIKFSLNSYLLLLHFNMKLLKKTVNLIQIKESE